MEKRKERKISIKSKGKNKRNGKRYRKRRRKNGEEKRRLSLLQCTWRPSKLAQTSSPSA